MRSIFAAAIAVVYVLVCLVFAAMALAALGGLLHPALDLFNHGQPILFFGLIVLMLFSPLVIRSSGTLRALALTLAATGFVASSVIYIPEVVRGFSAHAPWPEDERPVYTLMTFNVFGRNETPEAIVAQIHEVDPDFVAVQEYHRDVRHAIHRDLIATLPHFQYCAGGERAFVSLYSKFPFEPLNEDACSASLINTDRTARIIVRFDIDGGPEFALATTHNDWPAPITRQVEQFAAMRDALATVEPPVIVVGDFNSTPWSYALRNFVSESGLTRHTFNLATFPKLWHYLRDWRPTPAILPIDHVMSRGGIAVHSLRTGEPSGSDHLPVIVEFSVNPIE